MSRAKTRFSVRGSVRDLLAFASLAPTRRRKAASAPVGARQERYVDELAEALHPDRQRLEIAEVIEETRSARTYRLVPDREAGAKSLAYFRAGQYLSLKLRIGGGEISRPYSISSSPSDALSGFYDITIRRAKEGYFSSCAWENWEVGTKVTASGPSGFLYYESLRDSPSIVGIAGGSGVTPFRSIAREIAAGKLDATLSIIYGCSDDEDIIFKDELK